MHADTQIFWVVLALSILLSFIAMTVLPGWLRSRRQTAVQWQIALTDALDGQLGPIVAPVVTQPLLGPWRIEIAVPLARPKLVGRILAVTHKTLSLAEGMTPSRYQIVLTAQPGSVSRARQARGHRTSGRWIGSAAAA
jgi:hypothetical protein